jgi:hypothetical protein
MSFHAKDGWYFDRLDGGQVRITKRVPVLSDDGEYASERAVIEIVELDENSWASVVASVSEKGEDRDTFDAAQRLHRGHVHDDSETEQRLRSLLTAVVTSAYGETTQGGRTTTEVTADAVNAASDYLGFTRRVGV